ncbi:MAG: ribosome hibernation-promoting factor, HPF/YfiA family [bacterium]
MKIHITARHMEMTDGLRKHIEEKLEQITKVAFHEIEVSVILSVEKYRQYAEITLTSEKQVFSSTEHTNDMYASIDKAIEKLDRQLHKYKEKKKHHKVKDDQMQHFINDVNTPETVSA